MRHKLEEEKNRILYASPDTYSPRNDQFPPEINKYRHKEIRTEKRHNASQIETDRQTDR
jgi:hypothetical protein